MSGRSLESLLNSDKNITSYDITEDDEINILEPWQNLLHHLSIKNLEDLRNFFKDELDDFSDLKLNKEEFIYAIDTVLGNSNYSLQAISLYNEITYADEDKITWNQFLDYFITYGITEQHQIIQFHEPEIFTVPHVERETIIKIVSIETETSFCYTIVSKYGKIGLYTGDFNLLQKYQVIFTRTDNILTEKYKRIKSMWVTDAIFLPNVNIFVVCNTARSMMFYDASGQKHIPMWLIEGIPNAIYCLEYFCDTNLKLFLGNDFGSITTITFLQQKEGLFRRKYNDKMTHYYWKELKNESTFVRIETFTKIHSSVVLNMKYYPETYSIVSCSRDKKHSVVFFNLKQRKKTYTFKISQGVCCFSLSHQLHILLTGSDSGVIHLWNLYVSSKAITTFQGHQTAIIDVQILAFINVALTCSRDGILKIWNLQNHSCNQTITIKFPCFEVLGKLIEWGNITIYSGPKRIENLQNKEDKNNENGSKSVHEVSDERENKIDIWQRFPILISCCNFAAKLNINNDENNLISVILPPPPLQNEIIIPEDWKIDDPIPVNIEPGVVEPENEFDIKELHPVLKSIIERDFLKSLPRHKHDMNYKIAALEIKKIEMKKPVSQCAPYLALDLYEIDEVKLSPDLPVPNCKKTQQIVEKTQRLLSAASTRSGILSDRSSKSRSSRSSVIEF